MERIKYYQFASKMLIHSGLSRSTVSALCPSVYEYEEKYYRACEDFVTSGTEACLTFDEYSTDMIKSGMHCGYIEAVIILRNIEKHPENAHLIYRPYTEA